MARATLSSVLCLLGLAAGLLLLCEGLRAADKIVGSRVALVGVAAALGTFILRYVAKGMARS